MPDSHAHAIDAQAVAQLFTDARTFNAFTNAPVTDAQLRQAVELMKIAPTSANQSPMRVVFLRSDAAKARLKSSLGELNLAKTLKAPVVAITGFDPKFYNHLPFLFPHADAKAWFTGYPGSEAVAERAAFQNATIQAGYLILALRAIGLDTGPMTGFDPAKLDAEFFADGSIKSNILINIGYGDKTTLFPRSPRLAFDQIAKIV